MTNKIETVITADGRTYLTGKAVQCVDCGTIKKFADKNFANGLASEAIERKFKRIGWEHDSKGWHCPEHTRVAKRRAMPKPEPSISIILTPATLAPKVQLPEPQKEPEPMPDPIPIKTPEAQSLEKMQPADRRRIFRAVDENWDDKRGRYIGNVTDATIAVTLDVPRLWVQTIRREAFGESADNDEIEAVRTDLANLRSAIKAGEAAVERSMEILSSINKAVAAAEARLLVVEKSVGLKR